MKYIVEYWACLSATALQSKLNEVANNGYRLVDLKILEIAGFGNTYLAIFEK